MGGKGGRAGLSQTDDQILRQPVRELESMKESDACLRTLWQPNTLLHTHTQKIPSCCVCSSDSLHSSRITRKAASQRERQQQQQQRQGAPAS